MLRRRVRRPGPHRRDDRLLAVFFVIAGVAIGLTATQPSTAPAVAALAPADPRLGFRRARGVQSLGNFAASAIAGLL